MALTDHTTTSQALSEEMRYLQDNKCLKEQIDVFCNSMEYKFSYHDYSYLVAITQRETYPILSPRTCFKADMAQHPVLKRL